MSQFERLEKLRNKHVTVNKTYPPYIEHKNVVIDYEAINPIDCNVIKNDIIKLNITDGTRSSPLIYKNIKTNQYYIQYKFNGYKFSDCLFDITDNYNWDKVIQENILKKEFITKKFKHIIPIFENILYSSGSPVYNQIHPPVK
jgi:hypothetical protein